MSKYRDINIIYIELISTTAKPFQRQLNDLTCASEFGQSHQSRLISFVLLFFSFSFCRAEITSECEWYLPIKRIILSIKPSFNGCDVFSCAYSIVLCCALSSVQFAIRCYAGTLQRSRIDANKPQKVKELERKNNSKKRDENKTWWSKLRWYIGTQINAPKQKNKQFFSNWYRAHSYKTMWNLSLEHLTINRTAGTPEIRRKELMIRLETHSKLLFLDLFPCYSVVFCVKLAKRRSIKHWLW